MSEWSNVPVLKTGEGNTSGGSNPPLPAILKQLSQRTFKAFCIANSNHKSNSSAHSNHATITLTMLHTETIQLLLLTIHCEKVSR